MTFALHVALLTPAASPYAAVLFGNRDWLPQKDIFKYGFAIVLMAIVLYTTVGVRLIRIIY